MNIVLNINNINFNNLFFNDPVKNTVMNDSSFIRILYSNEHLTLNGIFIKIPFDRETIKDPKNENNQKIILFIDKLEKYILSAYNNNKIQVLKILEQFNYITTKSFLEKRNNNPFILILKISGIWETNSQIGITHKFIDINHL